MGYPRTFSIDTVAKRPKEPATPQLPSDMCSTLAPAHQRPTLRCSQVSYPQIQVGYPRTQYVYPLTPAAYPRMLAALLYANTRCLPSDTQLILNPNRQIC